MSGRSSSSERPLACGFFARVELERLREKRTQLIDLPAARKASFGERLELRHVAMNGRSSDRYGWSIFGSPVRMKS